MRTLRPGTYEFVWGRYTSTIGQNLTEVGVEIAYVSARVSEPAEADWQTPDDVDRSGAVATTAGDTSMIRASLLVLAASGEYAVHLRITDNPEIIIARCGLVSVPA